MMQMNTQDKHIFDERETLLKLKAGDHAAFEQIYHAYKDRLIANLLRLLKSRALVEEIVQDLFLQVWKGRAEIDLEKSFKAFLFKIGANLAKNVIRKAYYDKKIRTQLLPIELQIYSPIEDALHATDIHEAIESILDSLPPQRRIVFKLCKLEGKSYKEVSELLNISENTVNDHIKKANHALGQLKYNSPYASLLMILWIMIFTA